MSTTATERRMSRRTVHRSRSVAASIALALVALFAAWIGTESVLAALGYGPLLLSPADLIASIADNAVWVLPAAAALAILGLIFVILALLPARRGRHELPHDRLAVVVDDRVLAGALGRVGRLEASLAPERVLTSISARRAIVSITPTSGIAVDTAAITTAVDALIAELQPRPAVRATVAVTPAGVVGS